MQLDALLRPSSIAVVGASAEPSKLSHRPLQYLLKHAYPGRLYAVNPRAQAILGIRSYPTVGDLPEPVDLALLLVPGSSVLETLAACQEKGIRSAILFGSGFAEAGETGREEQRRIAELLEKGSLRLLGPNCMGLCSLHERVAATFSQSMELPALRPGHVAFVGQSGALGGSVLNMAQDRGLGFSYWVTTGNQVDLDTVAIARALVPDDKTRVICLCAEHILSGANYLELLREVREHGKELVVLKAGRSEAGRRAAISHTGRMAGWSRVFDAVTRQGGAHLVHDLDEMLDVALALSQMPPAAGPALAVVTTSGGAGILLADQAADAGIVLPTLDAATRAGLGQLIPSYGTTENPVDVTAQLFTLWQQGRESAYRDCFSLVGRDPGIDVIVIAPTMIAGTHAVALARDVARSARSLEKPVVVAWLAGTVSAEAFAVLQAEGIPLYHSATRSMRAIRALVEAGRPRPALGRAAAVERDLERPVWTEADLHPLLAEWDLPVPASALVDGPDQAVSAAERIGYPVVLKLQSPDLLHKTEHGAVALGLENARAVREAYGRVRAAGARAGVGQYQGLLVQQQVPGVAELMVSVRRDPEFGPVLVVGYGGIAAELWEDLAIRLLPVGRVEAEAMLAELRSAPLLKGWRGRPAVDAGSLADFLVRVGELGCALGNGLAELEFNPVIAGPDGIYIADALLVAQRDGSEGAVWRKG